MSYGTEEDRRAGRIAAGIGLVIVLIAAGWWWWQRGDDGEATAEAPVQPAVTPDTAGTDEPPSEQYPLAPAASTKAPAADTPPALPPDEAAQVALAELFGPDITSWLVTEQLARRLVATVDNLPRNTRIEPLRPVRAPAGPFVVEREMLDATVNEERIVLAAANFARYDGLMALFAGLDVAQAAAVYRRIYPQLQSSYLDLGYPNGYFNDRVVAVIDHLLATPEPTGPLLLEQPKVLYRFADPKLEALSSGQKLLLRIGPEHAHTVKQKLGELRLLIATPARTTTRE